MPLFPSQQTQKLYTTASKVVELKRAELGICAVKRTLTWVRETPLSAAAARSERSRRANVARADGSAAAAATPRASMATSATPITCGGLFFFFFFLKKGYEYWYQYDVVFENREIKTHSAEKLLLEYFITPTPLLDITLLARQSSDATFFLFQVSRVRRAR